MRTLHYNPLFDFHKPDWHTLRQQLIHVVSQPWLWAVLFLSLLFVIAVMLAVYGKPTMNEIAPSPLFYP